MSKLTNFIIGIALIIGLAWVGLFILKIAVGLITIFTFGLGTLTGYFFRALTHPRKN